MKRSLRRKNERNGLVPDTPAADAFGRARVSSLVLLAEAKRVGSVPDNTMTNGVAGSGSAPYNANTASTHLTVGTAIGKVTRQTKARIIYQPGKSLLVLQTFVMADGEVGLKQRVGYHDDNNGVFLAQIDGRLALVRREKTTGSVVEEVVYQSPQEGEAGWSLDQMTNEHDSESGVILDVTKTNILIMDYEWLGVGRVRVGFVVDGMIYYVHEFLHANNLINVYMSSPNLVMRWEIEATATLSEEKTLQAICGAASSEGGYELNGITAGVDMGTAHRSIGSGTIAELLAIRLQASFIDVATAFVQGLSAINLTTADFAWRLVLNPTETAAGTWADVAGSVMSYNVGRTVTPGTGLIIASGYVSDRTNQIQLDQRPVLTLGTEYDGVTDVISLQIVNLSNQSESFLGSLVWREVF